MSKDWNDSASSLTNEQLLMILASRIHLSKEEETHISNILEEGIRIEMFLPLCIKHKVLPLVSQHLIKLDLNNHINLEYKKIINYAYQANKLKNNLLMRELLLVLEEARAHGLQIIPLKGALLIPEVYQDVGLRISNDLDFLISLDQSHEVSTLLRRLGYTPGHYNWATDEVSAATEDESIQWKNRSGNLHPHMKKMDDGFAKYFGIDFSYDVDLSRTFVASNGLRERAKIREFQGTTAVCLENTDFLIHIAIHLYKEASHEKWMHLNQDINLIKFCDIREYILANIEHLDWRQVSLRARKLGAIQAVYYSFYYLKLIFGDPFADEIKNYLNVSEFSFLDRYISTQDNAVKIHKNSFFERFFSLSNDAELNESSGTALFHGIEAHP